MWHPTEYSPETGSYLRLHLSCFAGKSLIRTQRIHPTPLTCLCTQMRKHKHAHTLAQSRLPTNGTAQTRSPVRELHTTQRPTRRSCSAHDDDRRAHLPNERVRIPRARVSMKISHTTGRFRQSRITLCWHIAAISSTVE